MNVNELLDTIEDALEESAGMPLSGGKRIVDVEQIRDYLDEVRSNLPVELRQAQSIVSDRAQLIESANAQAQAIVKKAEERARILVSEAEIIKAAQQRASEIVSAAQTEARTVRQTVTDYCDHRGDHGGKCRPGQERAGKPAPVAPQNHPVTREIRRAKSTPKTECLASAAPVSKNDGSQGHFLSHLASGKSLQSGA